MKSREPSEVAIHQAVLDHWRACGLPHTLVATIPNMGAAGQAGLTRGLPDLLVIGPKIGVRFIELKTATGRISDWQKAFIALCEAAGIPSPVVTRGRDEPIILLRSWSIIP
jgi:hypothetical protein